MNSDNFNPKILPEVQSDVSKFFDAKISIFENQEKRLEKLLKAVRAYSDSYKLGKEKALSALNWDTLDIGGSKEILISPTTESTPTFEAVVLGDKSKVVTTPEWGQITTIGEDEKPVLPLSSDLVYDKHWNHSQKVQFVILEPNKYGLKTFEGSNSVVDAILTHEPEWAKRESRAAILAKIAPTISKLVKRRKLVKLRVKGSKAEFHYVSRRWYDLNGTIKPEYRAAIAHLELIVPEKKLAPVGAGANAESETKIGENSSVDAAEKLNGQTFGLLRNSYSF